MIIPTYYTVLDWTANFFQRFKKDDGATPAARNTRARMLAEAVKRYDNIVGRFDTLGRIPSRELATPANEKEAAWLRKNGVVVNDQGQWIVPEGMDLAKFEPWFPEPPEDLRDKTPRLLTTKNGRSVASYIEASDRAKGADSTATSLLYGGMTATAGLVFLAGSVWGPMGYLAALLFIPFTWALSQAEGPGEGMKSLLLLGAGPLALAWASVGPTGAATGAGVAQAIQLVGSAGGLVSGLGAVVGAFVAIFIAAAALSLVLDSLDPNRRAGIIGGSFQKFKAIMKWATVYVVAFALSKLLPLFLQPIFYFAMASIYPMVYTNANFVRRAKLLERQARMFNLARMGQLSAEHIQPKQDQAKRAFEDKSPLIKIGKARGWLTNKHYPYAPDAGVEMCLSAADSTMHVFCFGRTGSGKSTTVARPYIKQWWDNKCGGMLILDGKGSLPGELSSLIDVMITPGVNFAPLQGLDGTGVSTALNSVAQLGSTGDNDNAAFWKEGASTFIVHACQIFEALNRHEKAYIQYAANCAELAELDMDAAQVAIAQAHVLGEDDSEAQSKLDNARHSFETWAAIRDTPRTWLWNFDTLVKVCTMINSPVRTPTGWQASQLMLDALEFLGYKADATRKARNPATIYPMIGQGGVLDTAIAYVLDFWVAGLEPQQRSSYFGNVEQRINPVSQGPYLVGEGGVHWKTLEEGVDAGACLYGGSVGVDLPPEKHQRAGVIISALVKQRVYNAVALRGSTDWKAEGQKPLLVAIDECQDLVSPAEMDLLPKARGLMMSTLMLTQGYENIVAKLGNEDNAQKLCNTFQNLICLRSSPRTYKYMAERLGEAPLLSYMEKTAGLDMEGGVKALAASALSDDEHPYRSAMRKLERLGAGRLAVKREISTGWQGHRLVDIEDDELAQEIIVPHGGKLETQPLFLPEEYEALTTFGKAIVYLTRAGEKRIDVAELHPVFADELRKKVA